MTVNTSRPGPDIPSGLDFARSQVLRAWESPEEVILHRHIIESRELQPEDIGVLARLLIRDPAQPATIVALAKEFQDSGWKMGESRFTAIFKRLKQAGHVQHVAEFNPATGRPHWVFKVYRNPANNEQYVSEGADASLQVRAETEVSTVSGLERASETVEIAVSPGQSETVESTDSGAKPWKSGIRKTTVSRGQSRNRGNHGSAVHPPHPPEEVETSSPYPHKPEEEAARFTADEIHTAEQFLQLLPAPWAAGRQTAKAQAPKLLAAASEQGWQLDAQLAGQLTANPDGIKNYPAVLKTRIADLPLHAAVHRNAPAALRPATPPVQLPTWCEDLDCDEDSRLRCITDTKGYRRTGPCPDCHPDAQTREAA